MLHEIDSSLDYHKLMFSHPSHAWRMQRVTKTLLLIFVLIHGWPSCLQYLHQGNWAWAAPCSKLRWSVGHQMVTAVWLWILDRWMYTRNTYYEKMSLIIWQTKYFCTKSQCWIKIKAGFFAKMTKVERIIVFHLSVKNLVPQNVIKMSSLTNESTLKMLFVISHQGAIVLWVKIIEKCSANRNEFPCNLMQKCHESGKNSHFWEEWYVYIFKVNIPLLLSFVKHLLEMCSMNRKLICALNQPDWKITLTERRSRNFGNMSNWKSCV